MFNMDSNVINDRLNKLNELKGLLNEIDDKILLLAKEFNWDHKSLLEEKVSNMVTCSINQQHRVPYTKIKIHEQKCSLHHQGYSDNEKCFPEHSGTGSFVTLTPQTLHSITKYLPSSAVFLYAFIMMELKSNQLCENNSDSEYKYLRNVPQSTANFDQNFNREEKLAIYDYVIANTQKQKAYSDLCLQITTKSEEKKEMTAWEIAAAERDAKRRRASYRNKVHTNRKTHTEISSGLTILVPNMPPILREVIDAQMEAFKEEETNEKWEVKKEKDNACYKKSSHESKSKSSGRSRYDEEYSSRRSKEDRDKRRSHDQHSKHRDHKRSPSDTGSDIKSRSRFHDKYRKWKTYEGRSNSHRSSHTHKKR